MYHKAFWFFRSVFVLSAMLVLSLGYVQAQITGFIPVFVDELGNEDASVIFQDSGTGNVGIGTTTPMAKLHVAGGNVQLDDSTATAGNILKGGALFLHNFGTNNTFLGQNAGNLTMTGIQNTAIGGAALFNNTTGENNTASGGGALQSNTTGSQNTASGSGALANNMAGSVNTASGLEALVNNTTGNNNTAMGGAALGSNTTGGGNTAIGGFADVSVGNLTNATAIGFGATVNASNKIRLGNAAVTLIEGQGDFHASGPGNGIILKSPNGAVCRRLGIDNAGALVTTVVACP